MWLKLLRRLLFPSPVGGRIARGLYHYREEVDGAVTRYHLRVDADGAGVLTVNARGLCRLSPVGVRMAQGLLTGEDLSGLVPRIAQHFRGQSSAVIHADLRDLQTTLANLSQGRAGTRTNLDSTGANPFARSLSAPLCADVELGSLEAGRAMVDRLRAVGIPQIVWVISENNEEQLEHLPELVERVEDQSLICGIRCRAGKLPAEILDRAIEAGLDHLDLLFVGDGAQHASWLGRDDRETAARHLETAREKELSCLAVVPLRVSAEPEAEADDPREVVGALRSFGFEQAAFHALFDPASGAGKALPQLAVDLEEALDAARFGGHWGPPHAVPAAAHPAAARRGPRTVGEVSIRINSDGGVQPPWGPAGTVGNLLADTWQRIWSAPTFAGWREASEEPPRCPSCPGLEVCRGGCPVDNTLWASSEGVAS